MLNLAIYSFVIVGKDLPIKIMMKNDHVQF